ncbi:MAG: PIN domain-containing protein [Tannerella sp.]|jgi:predicted nucleic acid-binding protein|nr:PIN domain-containing protein [Tannerella sp.]
MNKFALDTNVLIYSHDESAIDKQNIARDLIVRSPIICTQVVSEYISVLHRVMKIPKASIINACMPNLKYCQIQAVDIVTLQTAERLIQRYDFQIFDAIIIASALEIGCQTLYSEDMQHKIVIDQKLSIINPFL